MANTRDTLRRWKDGTEAFFRDFTDGLDSKGVQRLFDQEATEAFRALTGRREDEERPEEPLERFAQDVRDFFRGLLLHLSPARRLLLAVAFACPILSVFDLDMSIGPTAILIDSDPFFLMISIALLVMLLALELVDRLRVRDELEVARQLQRDLLPQESPPIAGWRIAHSYATANEIGGDYYDFLPLEDGRVVIAVGDASGHGIGAGLLMAIGNAMLETAVDLDADPQAALALLGRTLFRTGGRRAFMTLFYGLLDPETGRLDWANAGHPYPMLRRAGSHDVIEVGGEGSFPLGLRLEAAPATGSLTLDEGDLLVLYSDGIPEAEGDDGSTFGFGRLTAQVAVAGDADNAHDGILKTFRGHLGSRPLRDDVTLVALSRHSVPAIAPPG